MSRCERAVTVRALAATALLAALATPAGAATTEWVGNAHAAVRLVTASDTLSGASPIEAGLQFRFAPGWHGYWRTPGDAGIAPAIDWSRTPGLTSADIDWPAPARLVVEDLQNATYDGIVTLPARLTVADPRAPLVLRASIDYGACANVCLPLHADLALTLPAGPATVSPEAGTIASARSRVPGSPAGAGITILGQAIAGSGPDRTLTVTLRSEATPFVHPDLFVEGAGDGLPPAPAVRLSDGGRSAVLTVRIPEAATPDRATAGDVLTETLVDGDRAASFAGPILAPPRSGDRQGSPRGPSP